MTRPSLQQSIDIVRTASYQAYLCSLLVPEPARSAVFALRAFHLETGQIKDKTTTVGIARMRLEFWRTAVNSAFDPSIPTVNHPIVQEIELARKNGILFSQSWLQRILNEREKNLTDPAFTTVDDVFAQSEAIDSSLNYAICESLSIKDVQADHVASHIGKAQGIVSLLQSTPANISKRQFALPSQFLASRGISTHQIYKDPGCLRDIVFDVASEANSQLKIAKGMPLPDGAWLALLGSSVPTSIYLDTLEKCDFNLFDSRLTASNWRIFKTIYKSYHSQSI